MEHNFLHIVIAGGGSGIGAALATEFATDGNSVVICGRRLKKLKEVAQTSNNILYYTCDVSNEKNVIDFSDFVKNQFDHIDVIINCAGVFGPIDRFDKTDSEQWKKTFEINTFGTYLITKHFLPLILHSDTKKIINFAGGGTFNPFPNYSSYAVSKAAVVRLSENMAIELANYGIKVNCVAPGFVATELHDATLDAGRDKAGEQYDLTIKKLRKGFIPMDTPINCVKFLISHDSDELTGKTISASFDRWNTDVFRKAIKEINSSDLYTLRRINLINLEDKDKALKVKMMEVQKRG